LRQEPTTPDASENGGRSLKSAERRRHPRQRIGSIAYVELEDDNGGIVINVSEGGLSLTAVGVLDTDHPLRVRIQVPRSRDLIDVPAVIAWVSESKKEAGIRFHELTPEAGTQIKKWIYSESPPAEIQEDTASSSQSETPLPVAPNILAPEIATTEPAPQVALEMANPIEDKAEDPANSPMVRERRIHARSRVKSLVYIELGASNCGIVVNISENGLHVEAAIALVGDRVPLMRFQIPHSRKWIETSGKVVWVSEPRREAGIQFVDLPADERVKIREWVSHEASSAQIPTPSETVSEKSEQLHKIPVPHEPRIEPLGSGASDKPHPMLVEPPRRSPTAPSTSHGLTAPATMPARSIQFSKPAAFAKRKPRAKWITNWMSSGLPIRDWRTLAAVIALFSLLSFVIGWFAARERTEDKITHVAGATANATAEGAHQGDYHEPPTVLNRNASVPAVATGPAGNGGGVAQRPPANSASNVPSRQPEGMKSSASSTANVSTPSPIEKSSPAAASPATQTIQSAVASPGPIPQHSEEAAAAPAKEKENTTPSPKPPENPVIPEGSVSVSFPAFPSIRVPPELKSPSSRLGMSLQIGQVFSRVEPLYPEAVRAQRIEGTVKLHAIIGRDGAIQSVELVSGPPLLAPLAMGAIRVWHFKPTLLGGRPIETEMDFSVVFRLANSAIRSN
jgi:outer membrane biosynthesis protein TonB